MAAADKLTRWFDLIAALLRRRNGGTFEEFRYDVPAYITAAVNEASIMRTFERDKDELRAFGVAIETLPDGDGGESRYRLRPDEFYLPLLALCESRIVSALEVRTIARPKGIGFQTLPVLAITPDECLTLRRAAGRVRALGNPTLDADAAGAIRKLEQDVGLLPIGEPIVAAVKVHASTFEVLGAALSARQRVTFSYASMGRNQQSMRTVEPYGLVFLTGHWYLVAHDPTQQALRQFRVSRISKPKYNAQKKQPDYVIPATFDLEAHAASRQSWELGDEEAVSVVVAFRGESGQVQQGMQLGEETSTPSERCFRVRRRDPFLRWLLTFGGDASIVSPAEWHGSWRTLLHDTLSAHRAAQSLANAAEVA
ncbi:helix-turn-helix transcriptional regulator [Gemmatimonas groenlandica]|uniref:WYL domain-containing protein n=1 Tax=Gemmatimonas groenlandica TaxID=2732249 RepID=A0A6M4IVQ2_9BACT|nr:WYL domain-containing protein [Gemmatimonas groenlandica]QJR36932.1 WYL domain-containing protein [Gemmatimonas groenlandica]